MVEGARADSGLRPGIQDAEHARTRRGHLWRVINVWKPDEALISRHMSAAAGFGWSLGHREASYDPLVINGSGPW